MAVTHKSDLLPTSALATLLIVLCVVMSDQEQHIVLCTRDYEREEVGVFLFPVFMPCSHLVQVRCHFSWVQSGG